MSPAYKAVEVLTVLLSRTFLIIQSSFKTAFKYLKIKKLKRKDLKNKAVRNKQKGGAGIWQTTF